MKINFGSIQDLRKECIEREIHEVRRDYMVETKAAESSNARVGKIGITRFKVIVTATDGMDVLTWDHPFYSCFSIEVNEERIRKDVEELTLKIEEQLHKDFGTDREGRFKEQVEGHMFTLKKGIIEEL